MKDRRTVSSWHKKIAIYGFQWFKNKRRGKRPIKDRRSDGRPNEEQNKNNGECMSRLWDKDSQNR